MSVTLDDVRNAAAALRGALVETPCLHSQTLSAITGAELYLKFENLQFTASFKERGALTALLSLSPSQRRVGVVAMSAGNHAQALAHHARRLGVPVLVVMPRFTPNTKVQQTREHGAEVHLHGTSLDEAGEWAAKLGTERGLHFVHPYDDERVIAGQGTVALEMLEAQPELELLLVPVGGGGLIGGMATAAKALRPDLEVVGVQTERFPSMRQALAGEPIRCGRTTLAEGIAVKRPGRRTLPLVRAHVDDIALVSEQALEEAVLLLLEIEKTVVEAAGAAGLAAVLSDRARFAGRRVGIVLSGGNIDLPVLSSIIQRGLVRSGRLVRLCVTLRDEPGALGDAAQRIGHVEGQIVEVNHQRAFTQLPLRSAEVEFVVQARGPEHVSEILSALHDAGFEARRVQPGPDPAPA